MGGGSQLPPFIEGVESRHVARSISNAAKRSFLLLAHSFALGNHPTPPRGGEKRTKGPSLKRISRGGLKKVFYLIVLRSSTPVFVRHMVHPKVILPV